MICLAGGSSARITWLPLWRRAGRQRFDVCNAAMRLLAFGARWPPDTKDHFQKSDQVESDQMFNSSVFIGFSIEIGISHIVIDSTWSDFSKWPLGLIRRGYPGNTTFSIPNNHVKVFTQNILVLRHCLKQWETHYALLIRFLTCRP